MRKESQVIDPVQKALRLAKQKWNAEVSAFIAENVKYRKDITIFNGNLIHLKKLMNGAPNKFYGQRGRITNPIPADPATIIGSLAEDFNDFARKATELSQKFNDLSQKGNGIVNQQLAYHQRRNPQQLSLPGISASSNYQLISEGSNYLTRFFSYLFTPTFGASDAAKIGQYRMTMLKACHNFYKDLKEFQEIIIGFSDEKAVRSSRVLINVIEPKWQLILKSVEMFENSPLSSVEDTFGKILGPEITSENKEHASIEGDQVVVEESPEDKSTDETKKPSDSATLVHSDESDKANQHASSTSSDQTSQPKPHTSSITTEQDYQSKLDDMSTVSDDMIDSTIREYKKLTINRAEMEVIQDHQELTEKFNKTSALYAKYVMAKNLENFKNFYNEFKSLQEDLKDPNLTADDTNDINDYLDKVAQQSIRSWVKKTVRQLFPIDDSSVFRVNVYNSIADIKQDVDRMMDSLESSMDLITLKSLIESINKKMEDVHKNMETLNPELDRFSARLKTQRVLEQTKLDKPKPTKS